MNGEREKGLVAVVGESPWWSFGLSAVLHAAIVGAIVGWLSQLGDNAHVVDVDLVVVNQGVDFYEDAPPSETVKDAPRTPDAAQQATAPPAKPPEVPTPSVPDVTAPSIPVPPQPSNTPPSPSPPLPADVAVLTLPPPSPPVVAADPPPKPAPPVVEPPKPTPPVAAKPPPPVAKPLPPKPEEKYVDIPAPVAAPLPPQRSAPPPPVAGTSAGNSGAGRNGTPGENPISLLSSPPPVYPAEARDNGEEGRVIVRAEIGTDGRPRNVRVQTSSGYRMLDEAAVAAVREWQFRNATRESVDMTVPVRFSLADAPPLAAAPPRSDPPPAPPPAPPAPPVRSYAVAPPPPPSPSPAVGNSDLSRPNRNPPAGPGDVAVLSSPAPVYPAQSYTNREEGRVIVYAEIDPTGTPRNVALDQTSGYPRLDQAAIETVRTWRFRNSSGRSVDITVPIRFVLRPNG